MKNITETQNNMEFAASIGLFTDGSKENSGYDLIDDLKTINEIIFAEEIQYADKPNTARNAFTRLLSSGSRGTRLLGFVELGTRPSGGGPAARSETGTNTGSETPETETGTPGGEDTPIT